jgi:hypothetical protein
MYKIKKIPYRSYSHNPQKQGLISTAAGLCNRPRGESLGGGKSLSEMHLGACIFEYLKLTITIFFLHVYKKI